MPVKKGMEIDLSEPIKVLEVRVDDVYYPIYSVAWSPDGRYLASGSEDGAVRVWDTGDWRLIKVLRERYCMRSVAWSPDGRLLAGGSKDGIVRVWDTGDWRLIKMLKGPGVFPLFPGVPTADTWLVTSISGIEELGGFLE